MVQGRLDRKTTEGISGRENPEVREAVTRAQQRTIDEAARKFAEVLMLSYKRVSSDEGSARRTNEELIRRFFDKLHSNLRDRADADEYPALKQVEPDRRRSQPAEELIQAHMEFLKAMADYSESLEQR